jgi:hypothetical protein
MSHEICKTTNCDSNTKGLSYGVLDYVFNLVAGKNIGLKRHYSFYEFKKTINGHETHEKTRSEVQRFRVLGSEVLGSRFRGSYLVG